MNKIIGAGALLVFFMGVPLTASAATAAEIQAQIQLMLAEVQMLQKQLAANAANQQVPSVATSATASTSGTCPMIGRVLKRSMSGDDVSRLQKYLAADPSVYPEAQVTGYFGALTEAAVMRWQTKYNIVSSGNPESTGFGVVGPRTAAAIALQCGGGSSAGVNPQNPVSVGPTVGGFIQVTPVTGIAPLAVQVIANVNTVASCEGAVYTLDWGDGTIASTIPVAAGTCSQTQRVFTHIYVTPSTYTIRLSAGQHSTTAMVQVGAAQ